MDFEYSETQEQYIKSVREFLRAEILPHVRAIDHNTDLLRANLRKLSDFGLAALSYPEEYGGSGSDIMTNTLAWRDDRSNGNDGAERRFRSCCCKNESYTSRRQL